ncbi:MAG: hypothetical protein LAP87_18160 [Acidobacteriia bacterium]|nr:hypothetical protein [Terriglobia bacterium]
MKNRFVVVFVLLIAVFLISFVPQYARAKRLEEELRAARQENARAQLRDLAGLAYLEASQRNYGLTAEASNRFFDRARELANQASDANGRKPLEELLSLRDRISAELAKGDPAVLNDLQALFLKTRAATGSR